MHLSFIRLHHKHTHTKTKQKKNNKKKNKIILVLGGQQELNILDISPFDISVISYFTDIMLFPPATLTETTNSETGRIYKGYTL